MQLLAWCFFSQLSKTSNPLNRHGNRLFPGQNPADFEHTNAPSQLPLIVLSDIPTTSLP